jgi:REP element-mobilizing transposase RayT
MRLDQTIRFGRRNLPHWEIRGGRYFVTVRCAGSLPDNVVGRLQEIHLHLQTIIPRSEGFAAMQRAYFLTMEKYLDCSSGQGGILCDPLAARAVILELDLLAEWRVEVPHFSIMPNHWHALLVSRDDWVHTLGETMKRVKGRSAKAMRRQCGGAGPVWQREWFDRWVRDEAEWEKVVDYIHNNPVKAGLAKDGATISGRDSPFYGSSASPRLAPRGARFGQ